MLAASGNQTTCNSDINNLAQTILGSEPSARVTPEMHNYDDLSSGTSIDACVFSKNERENLEFIDLKTFTLEKC